MSHVVTVEVEIRDLDAIKSVCRRLKLKEPVCGKTILYETEVEGVLVELTDWLYPIVCDLSTGKVRYDNYGGTWGDQKYLDRFVQTYTIEKASLEARKKGYWVSEQSLSDGSVRLTVNMGGAA